MAVKMEMIRVRVIQGALFVLATLSVGAAGVGTRSTYAECAVGRALCGFDAICVRITLIWRGLLAQSLGICVSARCAASTRAPDHTLESDK